MGVLVNWLAFANPLGILIMSSLMAFIASSGFTLQITQRLPYAAGNVLMALILFVVLGPLAQGDGTPLLWFFFSARSLG